MTPLLAAALLAASPEGGALLRAAEELASRIAEHPERGRAALAVASPGAEGLALPLETALAAALARRGFASERLAPAGPEDAERAARAAGVDLLVRVRAALPPGASDLVIAAELVPMRESFFLQSRPEARPPGGRLLQLTVPADAAAMALARPARRTPSLSVLLDVPGRVLALAAGRTGSGAEPRIVVVTSAGISLHSAGGERLGSRPRPPQPPGPGIRDPSAAVAVGDFGAGRIAWALPGMAVGEILSAEGDHLAFAGSLQGAPLAAGGAGLLLGAFAPGRGVFQDVLVRPPGAAARPPTGLAILGAAAAPRPGRVAFAVLSSRYAATPLGADLAPVAAPVPGVGAGFALADLDGDGEPELVASSTEVGPLDRVRVLRLGAVPEAVFQSEPLTGSILGAAAADLTGDGLDDAILGAVQADGTTRIWLLSADPRRAGP